MKRLPRSQWESLAAEWEAGNRAFSRAMAWQLTVIMLATACAMAVYQVAKHFILPQITLIQSNLITVLFTALGMTGLAYFVLRKQQSLYRRALHEMQRRRAAEARLADDLTARVEERTAELLDANRLLRKEIDLRSRTEDELRESQARHRSFFHKNHDVILIVDRDSWRIVDANLAACSFYGLFREQLTSRRLIDLYVEPADEVRRGIEQSLGGKRHHFPARQLTAGGRVRDVDIISGDFLMQGKKLLYMIIRDISEHHRLEKERDTLAKAVEQARESIFITDTKGRLEYVNPAFESITGYRRDEVAGRHVSLLDSGLHEPAFYQEITRTILGGKTWLGRMTHRNKGGAQYQTEGSISPMRNGEGRITHFVTVRRDITEEIKLRRHLRQSRKMEAVGTLAGGIAHDFNNLLQIIDGYVQLIQMDTRPDETRAKQLTQITSAVETAADLIKQLLTFSRKVEPELVPLDLNQQVRQAVGMLERTIPRMIRIETMLEGDLRPVEGDASQIMRVLLNLGTNARDAMPSEGRLTFRTGNAQVDEAFCRTHPGLKPGRYVVLEVRDTGHGMDQDCLEHLFEPFYTTKDVGRGTGLGLATVFGIVESHGGCIFCESRPRQGASFQIYLPALEKGRPKAVVREHPASISTVKGSETILVVDDEQAIVEMVRAGLESHGYGILCANSGEQALDIYARRGDGIDLLVMDLGMPGMGGLECLRRLIDLDPACRVLIASGYRERDLSRRALESGAAGFIGKPYRLLDLARTIRAALDQRPWSAGTGCIQPAVAEGYHEDGTQGPLPAAVRGQVN